MYGVKKRFIERARHLNGGVRPIDCKKAKTGTVHHVRVDEQGERIPLTIADTDAQRGTVTIIFQIVGQSTKRAQSTERRRFYFLISPDLSTGYTHS
jgi:hypothetical protein